MSLQENIDAVRRGAGLFHLEDRGVVRVSGDDRSRWLDGMITNDVPALDAAGPGAACRALLLTQKGRIVADLQVLNLGDAYLLEVLRSGIPALLEHLNRFIIADDVDLSDESEGTVRLALEGPASTSASSAAVGTAVSVGPLSWENHSVGDAAVRVAGFSLSGLGGCQWFVPSDAAVAVADQLRAQPDVVEGEAATLECLRIEAGEPLLGAELDDSVLPQEVGLDEAISTTKGCYTGQEVVARMRTRDRSSQRLVGLRFDRAGASRELMADGKKVGEVTSQVDSPDFGAIGLGFVKSDRAEADAVLSAGDAEAVVTELPFRQPAE